MRNVTLFGKQGLARRTAGLGGLATGLALLAVGAWGRVVGSGRSTSESRAVSGFDEVALAGSGSLTITQTGTESLTIQADDNILPLLTSDVVGHRLTLGTKPNTSFETRTPITYRLTVKDLRGLSISGSGDATATGITTPSLTVSISGSGTVMLSGRAESQHVTISGSGEYRARDFATRTASVTVTGSGDAAVNCSETLDARVSGSGAIIYTGHPAVTQRVTGSGTIRAQ